MAKFILCVEAETDDNSKVTERVLPGYILRSICGVVASNKALMVSYDCTILPDLPDEKKVRINVVNKSETGSKEKIGIVLGGEGTPEIFEPIPGYTFMGHPVYVKAGVLDEKQVK